MAEKKPKINISDEEREARRQRALQLRKEGKLGGKQKGAGRPKKTRAQEVVAEKTKEEGEAIFNTLIKLVKGGSDSVKLKAALALLEIETKEHEVQIKQAQLEYEQLDRAKLLELIENKLNTLKEQGVDIEGAILGSAKELRREGNEDSLAADGRALPPGEESRQD